jgi:hypothetical protein
VPSLGFGERKAMPVPIPGFGEMKVCRCRFRDLERKQEGAGPIPGFREKARGCWADSGLKREGKRVSMPILGFDAGCARPILGFDAGCAKPVLGFDAGGARSRS